jgi:hypothetical protein
MTLQYGKDEYGKEVLLMASNASTSSTQEQQQAPLAAEQPYTGTNTVVM